MSILLLYPPFSTPDKPYLSIPTLAAYLKSKGHHVDCLDVNLEFFRSFLSPASIEASTAYCYKRLLELNEKPELTQSQMIEYLKLIGVLNEKSGAGKYGGAPFINGKLSYSGRMKFFEYSVRLASMPYYPWGLDFMENTNYLRHKTGFKRFSSDSIFDSLDKPSFYSGPIEEIVSAAVKKHPYNVVGISVTFTDQILPAVICAKIIRKCLPETHITFGGGFVSYHFRNIKDRRWFDLVDSFVMDDGEIPLDCLIRELRRSTPQLRRVPSLVFYSAGQDKIVTNKLAQSIALDLLPTPDYRVFPLERYLPSTGSRSLPVRFSRGCYWSKCSFCSTHLPIIKCYNQPPGDFLYKQLLEIIEQTEARVFHIIDLASNPDTLAYLSDNIIKNKLDIKWSTNFRFDNRLTLERFSLYREAGCRSICLGLESYNDRILKLMKKGINTALVDRILSNISWAGIDVEIYMIVGFPTETREEALESFNKVKELLKSGVITNCVYNLFGIAAYSDISREPAKYKIAAIGNDASLDLIPPVSRYEGEGMTRDEAGQLFTDFVMELNGNKKKMKRLNRNPVPVIRLNGRQLSLNFGLREIISALQDDRGAAVQSQRLPLGVPPGSL